MKCRHCGSELRLPFLDLGSAPPSNAYLTESGLRAPETWFPLRLLACESCWLVQTEDHAGREALFTGDYAYFSSFSTTWLAHAERYVQSMVGRFTVRLFGSRVDDTQRGGDIDLLIEPGRPLAHRIQEECRLAARLYIKLGGRKVDVLIKDPLKPLLPIHEQALRNGIIL